MHTWKTLANDYFTTYPLINSKVAKLGPWDDDVLVHFSYLIEWLPGKRSQKEQVAYGNSTEVGKFSQCTTNKSTCDFEKLDKIDDFYDEWD